jgi:hypothetical protein
LIGFVIRFAGFNIRGSWSTCRTPAFCEIEFGQRDHRTNTTRDSKPTKFFQGIISTLMTSTLTILARATRKAISGPSEALLLFRMSAWVLVLSVAVKLFPLPRALRLVSTRTRNTGALSKEETQKRLADLIDLLLKIDLLAFKPVCWKRAALLHRYLALQGISTHILFGIRKEPNGSVSGHAWLESDGEAIVESSAPRYSVTYTFPSPLPFDVDLNLLKKSRY